MARLFTTTERPQQTGGGRLFGIPKGQDLITSAGLKTTAERAGLGEEAEKILSQARKRYTLGR